MIAALGYWKKTVERWSLVNHRIAATNKFFAVQETLGKCESKTEETLRDISHLT